MNLSKLLLLYKASKYGKTKHYVTIQVRNKKGTLYNKKVLVGSEKVNENRPKAMISIADLLIGRYTDKSIIIKGETFKNVEILRELKQQLGTGTWTSKQKGWIFPSKHKETVFGFLIEKLEKEVQNKINSGTDTDKTDEQQKDIDKLKQANKPKRKEPEKDDKKISEAINSATEVNRANITNKLYGELKPEEIKTNTPFQPKTTEYTFNNFMPVLNLNGGGIKIHGTIKSFNMLDYTDVKSTDIQIFTNEEIRDNERPSYIPDIDFRMFDSLRTHGYSGLHFTKLEDDKYIISATKFSNKLGDMYYKHYEHTVEERQEIENSIDKYRDKFYIVNRDVLAATVDYYEKLRKNWHEDRFNKKVEKYVDWARQKYNIPENIIITKKKELQDAVENSTGKIYNFDFPTMPRLNKKHKNTRDKHGNELRLAHADHFGLMYSTDKNQERLAVWDKYENLLSEINIAVNDLYVQREVDGNYVQALETSFGESGTVNNLLDEYGVKVKRQNGSKVQSGDIEDIKTVMSSVYSIFGNRSSISKRTNLKISHTGDKLVFASKAAGMYVPQMNTIAISKKHGEEAMGFTAAHEFAHFMDYQLGKTRDKHYISDDPKHIANKIATIFRNNMIEDSDSKYINRTCECFARAMEQYYSLKVGTYNELIDKRDDYSNSYMDKGKFNNTISPLIDQFLKENDHLLKSLTLTVVETFRELNNDKNTSSDN